METRRDKLVLTFVLAALASIALVWLCGWIAAPARHPELAQVVLIAGGAEKRVSGAAFDCRRDPELGVRICATALGGERLALILAAGGCRASLADQPLTCQLDYGIVAGFPSARVDAPVWTTGTLVTTGVPRLDFFGTLTECEWGRIAQLTGALVPALVVLALARRSGPAGWRRWLRRVVVMLSSMPPLWIALLWLLFRWRYLD